MQKRRKGDGSQTDEPGLFVGGFVSRHSVRKDEPDAACVCLAEHQFASVCHFKHSCPES